jgi:hypothetical protein
MNVDLLHPPGLEKRPTHVFFEGKHFEFVATGYTASMVPVRRVWLHNFFGHELSQMRGWETLSLM